MLLDLLFPPRCAGCAAGPWPFCERCIAELEPLAPPWCERCGLPAPRRVERCARCPPAPIDRARAAFAFSGPARNAVHLLKFAGWRSVADALAGAVAAVLDASAVTAEAVTWVPLGRSRLAARGYDQAHAIAVRLARRLHLPAPRLLRRTRETAPAARLPRAERRKAISGAFVAIGPAPENVVLVDDVLTTGATAAECARVLHEAGAARVTLATAARAVPREVPAGYTRVGSHPGLWLPGETPR